MKIRTSFKHKYLYLFIIIIALIGFISGLNYYNIQTDEMKTNISNTINIKNELSQNNNNIFKRSKKSFTILIFSLLVIPLIVNIFYIFYDFFSLGFIFNTLKIYGFKFSLVYNLFYTIIPLIIITILIRIGFSIAKQILLIIISKKDPIFVKHLKTLLKKYLLIFIILLIYEILICVFSPNINTFLLKLINY